VGLKINYPAATKFLAHPYARRCAASYSGTHKMIDNHHAEALEKFARLLNDPNVPIQPDLVWNLLEQVIKAGYVARDGVYSEG